MMRQVQRLIIPLALVLASYFGLTWFFFKSSHPCGILEARRKPYVVAKTYSSLFGIDRDMVLELMKDRDVVSEVIRHLGSTASIDKSEKMMEELSGLHYQIWGMTPAQCTWRAIAWDPDPYKKRKSRRAEIGA